MRDEGGYCLRAYLPALKGRGFTRNLMNNGKRTIEASSLRAFFDDQIDHLQKLVDNLSEHIHIKEQQAQEDRQIIESFVDASNSKMRAIDDYAVRLRGYVKALYNHILQVAEEIPPPIDLNLETLRTDPLVNALFVCSKDIDQLLKNDPDVNAYLRVHNKDKTPVIYAMLTANKHEKLTLGVGLLGDMLIRDLPQQVINFSSHKVHAPCTSNEELSTALKKFLFDRTVALVKQEMTSRMTSSPFKASDDFYESRIKSLANPNVYLNTLIEYIENPANLLSIEKNHLKLNKLGIKIDSDDDIQNTNEFDIYELTWGDSTQNVILQIFYSS